MSKKIASRFSLFFFLCAMALLSTQCKKEVIVTPPVVVAPVANFTTSAQTINVGESITFTDASTGTVTTRKWQITGGSPNISSDAVVSATFNTEGTYDVQLTVSNASGSSTKSSSITVKKPVVVVPPVANFAASATVITAGESITFTDNSTGSVVSRNWDIPGGSPSSSSAQSVVSQFNTAGTYSVKLTVANTAGSTLKTLVVTVNAPSSVMFLHTSTAANIASNWTTIDNPATNNNPNAVLIVTPNWGTTGPYHNKSIGVWYNNGKWTIFNQDISAMAAGVKFNVLVKNPSDKAFVAKAASISGHIAFLNHPSLNGNPNAKFLVTQNFGAAGPYNKNPIGIYYDGTRWSVYNQNFAAMPANVQFNVCIDDKIFVVTATTPSSNFYVFSNSATDSKPNALVFSTQYWTGVYNANEIGVWYTGTRWAIFNQSLAAMPANAKFMVLSDQ
ncbi:MAG: PKD domain-containing protein [Saprospiraceae bacterium]|nr:PKD domain-containing protein [Saprospiraceae bacterium]